MAKELYENYLKSLPEPVPEEDQIQFSDCWVQKWMVEYAVSLLYPNKRFSVTQTYRKERLLDIFKNLMVARKFFLDNFGYEPEIINADQMPIHRNESSGMKTLNIKNLSCFVKEN